VAAGAQREKEDDDADDIKPVQPTWAVGALFRGTRKKSLV
jgi:hypothetical protein